MTKFGIVGIFLFIPLMLCSKSKNFQSFSEKRNNESYTETINAFSVVTKIDDSERAMDENIETNNLLNSSYAIQGMKSNHKMHQFQLKYIS